MIYVYCILMGYLIGSINPSYLIAKCKGFDIRKKGSGNAGASNALIVLGKLAGAVCALFDIAKAIFVIWLAGTLFEGYRFVFAVTGTACILGHVFPFYMRFRGGKGLACLAGTVLAYNPLVFAVMLALEAVIVLVTNYLCFVPMTASVIFPFVYGFLEKDLWGALIIAIIVPVILWRHRENIARIHCGTELHFSYLWNKKKERERLSDVYDEEEKTRWDG